PRDLSGQRRPARNGWVYRIGGPDQPQPGPALADRLRGQQGTTGTAVAFYYEDFGSLELRDANFWPDFPTSARQIAHIYQMVTGHHLDGVVAVQPPLV